MTKDLLTRLADAGEEAIAKLAGSPGTDRMVGVANTMRERMDELQKRVRGLDELERRVTELERRLDQAEGKEPAGLASLPPTSEARDAGEKETDDVATPPVDETDSPATRTTRSGSAAEPTGPATQGASQAGNPTDV